MDLAYRYRSSNNVIHDFLQLIMMHFVFTHFPNGFEKLLQSSKMVLYKHFPWQLFSEGLSEKSSG